jgi:hypothetical protein
MTARATPTEGVPVRALTVARRVARSICHRLFDLSTLIRTVLASPHIASAIESGTTQAGGVGAETSTWGTRLRQTAPGGLRPA